ncbi:hypothetical protein [Kitasatospora sp. NE20-6]
MMVPGRLEHVAAEMASALCKEYHGVLEGPSFSAGGDKAEA